MQIPGHLAVGYLAAADRARRRGRAPRLYGEVLPVLLGALTPDLIDKGLLNLGVFPEGRTVGHSLFFLLALLLPWAALRRVLPPAAGPVGFWILGIASHFLANLADDFVGGLLSGGLLWRGWLLWPVPGLPALTLTSPVALLPGYGRPTPLELLAIAAALLVLFRTVRASRGRGPGVKGRSASRATRE